MSDQCEFSLEKTTLTERLARFLHYHVHLTQRSTRTPEPILIRVARTDVQLASYLGASLSALELAYAELARQGSIRRLSEHSIEIVNKASLVEIASRAS